MYYLHFFKMYKVNFDSCVRVIIINFFFNVIFSKKVILLSFRFVALVFAMTFLFISYFQDNDTSVMTIFLLIPVSASSTPKKVSRKEREAALYAKYKKFRKPDPDEKIESILRVAHERRFKEFVRSRVGKKLLKIQDTDDYRRVRARDYMIKHMFSTTELCKSILWDREKCEDGVRAFFEIPRDVAILRDPYYPSENVEKYFYRAMYHLSHVLNCYDRRAGKYDSLRYMYRLAKLKKILNFSEPFSHFWQYEMGIKNELNLT